MHRRGFTILGILLIVLGAVSFTHGEVTYASREEVVELGDLQIQTQRRETIPLPPLLGGLSLAGGIVLVVLSRRVRNR